MTEARFKAANWALPVLGGISLITLWWVIVTLGQVPEYIAPGPWAVAKTVWAERALILDNTGTTALEAVLGFALGNTVAILLAVVFVQSDVLRRMYFPAAVIFNTVPTIALAPILIVIFGIGILPKVVIAALICFFPTLVNMIRGLQSPTANELELMRIMAASPREILLRLRFPRALPFLFAALKITATSAVIGAIVGEWIGSTKGLGALIIQTTFNYRTTLLYATIFVSSLLALVFFALVVLAERRFLRWK